MGMPRIWGDLVHGECVLGVLKDLLWFRGRSVRTGGDALNKPHIIPPKGLKNERLFAVYDPRIV